MVFSHAIRASMGVGGVVTCSVDVDVLSLGYDVDEVDVPDVCEVDASPSRVLDVLA